MPNHVVRVGESVVSLAERFGFFPHTIWDAPENEALRASRPDMNALLPGDTLFIPELRNKTDSAATGSLHTYRRKGVPAHLRLQLYDYGEPRSNQAFTLKVGSATIEGTSDDKGIVSVPLPPSATTGLLTIGEDALTIELAFGHLDPASEPTGVQQRLANLGYNPGPADGEIGPRTQAALREFQRAQDAYLEVTGELDDATRDRLTALHDAPADETLGQRDDAEAGQ